MAGDERLSEQGGRLGPTVDVKAQQARGQRQEVFGVRARPGRDRPIECSGLLCVVCGVHIMTCVVTAGRQCSPNRWLPGLCSSIVQQRYAATDLPAHTTPPVKFTHPARQTRLPD